MKSLLLISLLASAVSYAETAQLVIIDDETKELTIKRDQPFIIKFVNGGLQEVQEQTEAHESIPEDVVYASLSTFPKVVDVKDMDPKRAFAEYFFCAGTQAALHKIHGIIVHRRKELELTNTRIVLDKKVALAEVSTDLTTLRAGTYYLSLVKKSPVQLVSWVDKNESTYAGFYDQKVGKSLLVDGDDGGCMVPQQSIKINLID